VEIEREIILKKYVYMNALFDKLGTLLNPVLLKFPILARYSCISFDITSRITQFLLHNRLVYISFYIFSVYMVIVHNSELLECLRHIKLTDWSAFQHYLSFPMRATLYFHLTLFDLILTNTLLVSTQVVQDYMKTKYHEDILKERGYNSKIYNLLKYGAVIGGIASAFASGIAGDVKKVDIMSRNYMEAYKEYVRSSNGVDIQPPQPMMMIEVTERVKKAAEIVFKK